MFEDWENCQVESYFKDEVPEFDNAVKVRVASLAFFKPNFSNLACFYKVWLRKVSFVYNYFLAYFWLFI